VCLQDGKSVVSGSDDKTVRVWDAATGKEVQKLEGHSSDVSSVSFSPVRVLSIARARQLRAVVGAVGVARV
jgi:WD40 repeat protein